MKEVCNVKFTNNNTKGKEIVNVDGCVRENERLNDAGRSKERERLKVIQA